MNNSTDINTKVNVIFELNEKESSNINSITWRRNISVENIEPPSVNKDIYGVLVIEFKIKNAVYEYYDVPFYVLHELITAKSFGKYVSNNIINKYTYKKIIK